MPAPAPRWRETRIHRSTEIRALFRAGRRRETNHFTLIYRRPNAAGWLRFGIVVSRRFGSAVERNRIKRVVREVLREQQRAGNLPIDLLVLPRPSLKGLGRDAMKELFAHQVKAMTEKKS